MWKFMPQALGPLTVFKPPEPGRIYTMGIDASTGLGNDYSVAQIVTNTLPFEQVAIFREKLPVNQVTAYVDKLGRFYNNALNVCEVNFPGNSVQDALLEYYKYPRNYQPEEHLDEDPTVSAKYGFTTTEPSKWMLIHQTQMILQAGELRVNDLVTLGELSNFVYQAKKKLAAAASGFNDDCVMALMLALHGAKLYPQVMPRMMKKNPNVSVDPEIKHDWDVFRRQLMGSVSKSKGKVL